MQSLCFIGTNPYVYYNLNKFQSASFDLNGEQRSVRALFYSISENTY